MVNLEGFLPSEVVTDTFVLKASSQRPIQGPLLSLLTVSLVAP